MGFLIHLTYALILKKDGGPVLEETLYQSRCQFIRLTFDILLLCYFQVIFLPQGHQLEHEQLEVQLTKIQALVECIYYFCQLFISFWKFLLDN